MNDPVVRSVRVAAALCDRFRELASGSTVVSAAKGRNALIGFKGEDDAFSLRVNEAQQIYPEIWSHLDDARKALAARGVDLTAYDVVRETERQFKPTGVDIDMNFTQYGDPTYGMQQTVKKANFNTNGVIRARSAMQAIQNALPNVDWAAIAKAEADDPQVKAFRRATIMKRIWMFVILIAVVGIPFWYVLWSRHEEKVKREKWHKQYEEHTYQPPPPQAPPANALPAQEQSALLEQAKKIAAELDAAVNTWPNVTDPGALAKLSPSPQPCPFPVTAPPKDAADTFIKTGNADPKTFAGSDFNGYLASDGPIPANIVMRLSHLAKSTVAALRDGRGTAETRDALKDLEKPIVFVVIDSDIEPKVDKLKPLELIPGRLIARGYIFDPHVAKVVCASTLELKGADPKAAAAFLGDAEDEQQAEQILHRVLEVRLREGLAAKLGAIGP